MVKKSTEKIPSVCLYQCCIYHRSSRTRTGNKPCRCCWSTRRHFRKNPHRRRRTRPGRDPRADCSRRRCTRRGRRTGKSPALPLCCGTRRSWSTANSGRKSSSLHIHKCKKKKTTTFRSNGFFSLKNGKKEAMIEPTAIAHRAAVAGLADALPGPRVTFSVFTGWMCDAPVAVLALPTRPTPTSW